ncbi:MAG: hypothetical protein NVS1B6_06520 [Steroidobacteraceae bacterium]
MVRLLWLLPKAAPAMLRHLVAYVELLALDLGRAHRELAAGLVMSAIVAVCGVFALLMACLGVVAYTWDTPYRVTAIACMGGVFLVAAIGAAVYRANAIRTRSQLFGALRREWRADRAFLDHLLSSDKE